MRGDLRRFEVARPARLRDALAALAAADGERPSPLAGGTDLFVALNDGHAPARRYLDLTRLDELCCVARDGDGIRLGALATYTDLRRSALVGRRAPILAAMAATVGAPAIQNRGTLGGSLANASPASDPAPVLQALDARIELARVDRSRPGRADRIVRREVPSAEFFTGYRATAARPDELICAVRIPGAALDGWRAAYRKVGARRAQAISKVVLAVAVRLDRRRRVLDARVSIGSVAPVTLPCPGAAAALRGARLDAGAIAAAREALAAEIRPIDDVRSTAAYRSLVAGNLLESLLGGL